MAIREKAGVISKKIEGNPLSPEKIEKEKKVAENEEAAKETTPIGVVSFAASSFSATFFSFSIFSGLSGFPSIFFEITPAFSLIAISISAATLGFCAR